MKQHIKEHQLAELSAEQLDEYFCLCVDRDWYSGHEGGMDDLDLLSIGQMIELLGEELKSISKVGSMFRIDLSDSIVVLPSMELGHNELCDALWEAVKYILMSKNL